MTPLAPGISRQASASSTSNWFDAIRKAGTDQFARHGFPAPKDEDWRSTNITPITRTQFAPASGEITAEARKLACDFEFADDAVAELVFINGHIAPAFSHAEKLPGGLIVRAFSQLHGQEIELARKHLGSLADASKHPFAALNASLMTDGAFVHIAKGVSVDRPVHLLFVSTGGEQPVASHPRILIHAEAGAKISIVESYAGGTGVHFTNSVTEISAEDESQIEYSRLQRGGEEAFQITTLSGKVQRNGRLISHAATLGGKLTRNELNIILAAPGADATINGLVILKDQQHCDNHTLLDHAADHCPSHELYKHVLDGKSSCVFRGKILVRQDAQKTDSKQTSKSLLLSDDATMNSQPALEIYADDVKCTHGSTTGPVDEEMIFYLRSRGIGHEAARHLLTYAFAADITRRIHVEPVRRRLEDYLAARHGLPRDIRITDLGQHDEKAR